MIATRFSSKGAKSMSLSYSRSDDHSVIIALEPLDNHLDQWHDVSVNNHVLMANNAENLNFVSFP